MQSGGRRKIKALMNVSIGWAESCTFYHKLGISQCNAISHRLEWSPKDSWGSYWQQEANNTLEQFARDGI